MRFPLQPGPQRRRRKESIATRPFKLENTFADAVPLSCICCCSFHTNQNTACHCPTRATSHRPAQHDLCRCPPCLCLCLCLWRLTAPAHSSPSTEPRWPRRDQRPTTHDPASCRASSTTCPSRSCSASPVVPRGPFLCDPLDTPGRQLLPVVRLCKYTSDSQTSASHDIDASTKPLVIDHPQLPQERACHGFPHHQSTCPASKIVSGRATTPPVGDRLLSCVILRPLTYPRPWRPVQQAAAGSHREQTGPDHRTHAL